MKEIRSESLGYMGDASVAVCKKVGNWREVYTHPKGEMHERNTRQVA